MSLSCLEVRHLATEDDGGQNDSGFYENQSWRVRFNGLATTRDAVVATDTVRSIPAYYTAHTSDSTMLVLEKTAKQLQGNPLWWDVRVVYKRPPVNFGAPPNESSDSTAKWDVQVEVSGVENQETVDADADGYPLLDSAGSPFELAIPDVLYDEVINVIFKTRVVSVSALGDARGLVNDASVTLTISALNYTRTFAAGTLKIGNVNYSLAYDANGVVYWNVNIPLLYRTVTVDGSEVGWAKTPVDQGFYYLSGGDRKRIGEDGLTEATDTNPPKATSTLLDGSGGILGAGEQCVLLPYYVEGTTDFSSLLSGIA